MRASSLVAALFVLLTCSSCAPHAHSEAHEPLAQPAATAPIPAAAQGAPAPPTIQLTPAPPAQVGMWERWQRRMTQPPYALDDASRAAERDKRGRLICPKLDMERYRGDTLRYHKPVTITPMFKPTLERFEAIAVEVAQEVYGRAPDRIIHYGTYNCRTIRHRKYRLSEHALGNAIDIAGFEFKTLPAKQRKALDDKRAGKRFRVDVLRHWDATRGFEAEHARFLKTLVLRLHEDATFRGMIVPPAPGHKNHLHLDMGRWSYLRGDPWLPEPDELTPQG